VAAEAVVVEDEHMISGVAMQMKFDDFLHRTCTTKLPILFQVSSRQTPSGTQSIYFSDQSIFKNEVADENAISEIGDYCIIHENVLVICCY
jgi:hypothetical protein